MAFESFARAQVDVAIVEAGIGATWDATSILTPAVVVATSVSLEHTDILGATLTEIAHDKAGAIKPGTTLVLSDGVTDSTARRIFCDAARSVDVFVLTEPLESYEIIYPAMWPAFQQPNLRAAIIAVEALLGRPLCNDSIQTTVDELSLPGRFEVLERDRAGLPLIMFDGAHNPEAAARLADAIKSALQTAQLTQKPLIALGVFDDKDSIGIIKQLDCVAQAFLPLEPPDSTRAVSAEALSLLIAQNSSAPIVDSWDGSAPLLITGSLSLYGTACAFLSA
jgi:dihydrofolate synthase/folylpolyglutamate synthase